MAEIKPDPNLVQKFYQWYWPTFSKWLIVKPFRKALVDNIF